MSPNEPVPLSEALQRIRKAGFKYSPDRWETWVGSGLVRKAERIEGTNSYGITQREWKRLQLLVITDSQLFGRRSPGAIAYFAALWGIDVPVDLVTDHIEDSVRTMYRMMRRFIKQQTGRVVDPSDMQESDIARFARTWAKHLSTIFPPIRNPLKRAIANEVATTMVFVMLSAMYNVERPRSFFSSVRRIADAIFTGPTVALGARFLRTIIERESQRLIDPDIGTNKMLVELRTVEREDPELILRACRDSGLAYAAAQRAFGYDQNPPRRPDPATMTAREKEAARMFYALLPTVTGYFLTMLIDNPKDRFLSVLRKDEGKTFTEYLRRLDRVTIKQVRRLETRP
jgi:hypothetical protein